MALRLGVTLGLLALGVAIVAGDPTYLAAVVVLAAAVAVASRVASSRRAEVVVVTTGLGLRPAVVDASLRSNARAGLSLVLRR